LEAYYKDQAESYEELKRDEKWDSIREFLLQIIEKTSNDPDSELHKIAKELLDIVDKAQSEPLSVSRYEMRKCLTGFDRCESLLKAKLEPQQENIHRAAETEQKAALSKGRRIIGWIIEGIIALALLVIFSYFFGLVTGILVVAALFTIFHLLGWLDAIRSLFTK